MDRETLIDFVVFTRLVARLTVAPRELLVVFLAAVELRLAITLRVPLVHRL